MGKRQAERLAEGGRLKYYKIKKWLSVLAKKWPLYFIRQMVVQEEKRKIIHPFLLMKTSHV